VTGASSGIGAALAELCAMSGARVIATARSADALTALAARCRDAGYPGEVIPLALDLVEAAESDATAAAAVAAALAAIAPSVAAQNIINDKRAGNNIPLTPRFPTPAPPTPEIHCVIHCAGVSVRAHALQSNLAMEKRVMALNLWAPVALTRALAAAGALRPGSGVLWVSSVQAKLALPLRSAYCASKHACHGYAEGLRYELAQRAVSLTVANPGYVATNLSRNALVEVRHSWLHNYTTTVFVLLFLSGELARDENQIFVYFGSLLLYSGFTFNYNLYNRVVNIILLFN